jgi:hydroxymethylglutaryl-CoA lyase
VSGAGARDVRIVEVGPRDGLQNEHEILPVDVRVAFIEKLAASGLREIEVGSFVRRDWVPQMADTEKVVAGLSAHPGVTFSALVPNRRGMLRAMQTGIRSVAVFTAASETFNRKNTNAGVDQSLERFRVVLELASGAGMRVRGYVSTAFACPYEGPMPPERGVGVARRLIEMGVDEVSIGDTIGVATPRDVRRFIAASTGRIEPGKLAFHFHDTRGTALANVLTALEAGFSIFDASAGGLGGCPYAPGASGNLATEDLVFMLAGMGMATGVDLNLLAGASRRIEESLDHPLPSRAYRALRACPA